MRRYPHVGFSVASRMTRPRSPRGRRSTGRVGGVVGRRAISWRCQRRMVAGVTSSPRRRRTGSSRSASTPPTDHAGLRPATNRQVNRCAQRSGHPQGGPVEDLAVSQPDQDDRHGGLLAFPDIEDMLRQCAVSGAAARGDRHSPRGGASSLCLTVTLGRHVRGLMLGSLGEVVRPDRRVVSGRADVDLTGPGPRRRRRYRPVCDRPVCDH